MALATAPRPPGGAPSTTIRNGRHGVRTGRENCDRAQRERRPGALGDLVVDLAAERGAVERAEPRLLAEDVLAVRHGQHVVLDLAHALCELGQGSGLGEHRGRDGTGGSGGDDLRCDLFDTDEVLQDADLEGAFGAAAGEDERGRADALVGRH